MEELKNLFHKLFGENATSIEPLTQAGSNRCYFRLTNSARSVVGVVGTSVEENMAFVAISHQLSTHSLPVPRVLIVSQDKLSYLQDDLGSTSLFQMLQNSSSLDWEEHSSSELTQYIEQTVKLLPAIQMLGAKDFDFSICYPQAEFNRRSVMWDLNYFKYYFLKTSNTEFQEVRLEDDFEALANVLLSSTSESFMYRDFQSRNVMLHSGKPYFIDFQGGRKGPYLYDIVSFLWQAKANFPEHFREKMVNIYFAELSKYRAIDMEQERRVLPYFVLFRTIQVLGAYGFRGKIERKEHFLQSIPFALSNLQTLLSSHHFAEVEYLTQTLKTMIENNTPQKAEKPSKLLVTIFSFSYKKDIPHDSSGNGGGFVFDCRAIHNPGRYAEYKQSTGLEQSVIEFLERESDIVNFLENVYRVVEPSVETYLSRNFTNLMISFGCTGGQHRSVYSAEHCAHHLHHKYNVDVKIVHREQHIETLLTSN